MLVLGINTSGPACDVAIVRGDKVLVHRVEDMKRGQDARLSELIAEAFEEADTDLDTLDAIGVVTGPGSFTGVRVGIAYARGLALALNIPCIGITSLEAALPEGQQGSAFVMFPAQRRRPDITFWTQRFRSGEATGPPEELRLEAIVSLLKAHPHMLYGDAGALTDVEPDMVVRAAATSAIQTARLAAAFDPETHPPRATYARAPDALLPGGVKL
ncbi:MAG: tRNA (adenosine(37)-N6)-threonylcarbamoyltransferase complex dimerization subunit type 1 TsaB [Henriciella sp.]